MLRPLPVLKQTVAVADGWFSSDSAEVYESATEALFLGRQDAMQRSTLISIEWYVIFLLTDRRLKDDADEMQDEWEAKAPNMQLCFHRVQCTAQASLAIERLSLQWLTEMTVKVVSTGMRKPGSAGVLPSICQAAHPATCTG
jgi:hypothetical protein